MTRVIINSHYIDRRISGLSRYARQIESALAASGFEVRRLGMAAVLPHGLLKNTFVRKLATLGLELAAPAIIKGRDRSVVHVSPAYSVPIGSHSARSAVVIHDLIFNDMPQYYALSERLYFGANLALLRRSKCRIVVPSPYVGEQVRTLLHCHADRIYVIPPYSSLPAAERAPVSSRYMICLSNAHPRKNLNATVAGFLASGAPAQGYQLVIAGNFETRPAYLQDRVKVIEGLDDQALASMIANASALLLFSASEGFGIPVVEAAVLGVPSLTSETAALGDLVRGRVARPCTTADGIAAKIDRFLGDRGYSQLLCDEAEELAQSYTAERFRLGWAEVIRKCQA